MINGVHRTLDSADKGRKVAKGVVWVTSAATGAAIVATSSWALPFWAWSLLSVPYLGATYAASESAGYVGALAGGVGGASREAACAGWELLGRGSSSTVDLDPIELQDDVVVEEKPTLTFRANNNGAEGAADEEPKPNQSSPRPS